MSQKIVFTGEMANYLKRKLAQIHLLQDFNAEKRLSLYSLWFFIPHTII